MIITQIQDYLASGFGYTVSPGRTPSNRDFVLYFLQEKKQGYCVHFASAACLLLRTVGIPARYAEGYCFDYTVYEEASAYEGGNTEWNKGYSGLDYDVPVTVELTDRNAHAWLGPRGVYARHDGGGRRFGDNGLPRRYIRIRNGGGYKTGRRAEFF